MLPKNSFYCFYLLLPPPLILQQTWSCYPLCTDTVSQTAQTLECALDCSSHYYSFCCSAGDLQFIQLLLLLYGGIRWSPSETCLFCCPSVFLGKFRTATWPVTKSRLGGKKSIKDTRNKLFRNLRWTMQSTVTPVMVICYQQTTASFLLCHQFCECIVVFN